MAKYDKARQKNKDRDDRIRRFYKLNPDMAYQEIADMFRLNSRQHAFAIINGKKRLTMGG